MARATSSGRSGSVEVEASTASQIVAGEYRCVVTDGIRLVLEMGGDRQVARLPVPPGQGLVGNLPRDGLNEAVLTPLGAEPVGLDRQDLLVHQASEDTVEVRDVAVERPDPSRVKVIPSTLPSATTRRSGADSASNRAATSACKEAGAPSEDTSSAAPSAST